MNGICFRAKPTPSKVEQANINGEMKMKMEIDLSDILHDEDYGSETLQESIKRQVVANITEKASAGIAKKIDAQISELINQEITNTLADRMPKLVDDMLNAEYTPVSKWNEAAKTTTIREQLIKHITEQMVYVPKYYDSEKNFFTKAVDNLMSAKMKEFQSHYNKIVDEMFARDVLAKAVTHIRTKLGIAV